MRGFSVCAVMALVLVTGPAGPATAQEAGPGDIRSLENCVSDFGVAHGQAVATDRCTGVLSASCGEREVTTNDIAGCIMDEYRAWDALLNRWWGPMRDRARADGTWDGLLASQRAWIADKEAACDAAYASAGGGTIRSIYYAECQRDRTAAKAIAFFYSLYK